MSSQQLQKIFNLPYNSTIFPGLMPRDIDRKHAFPKIFGIQSDSHREYIVSHKADGENGGRFFLGFTSVETQKNRFKQVIYLMNRKRKSIQIKLNNFPLQAFNNLGTLFDTEVIQVNGKSLILIFDSFMINGTNVRKKCYLHRLDYARGFLKMLPFEKKIIPSTINNEYKTNFVDIVVSLSDKYSIKVKKVYYIQAIPELLTKQSIYPNDGIILTALNSEGSNFDCLKWKPTDQCTIDFRIQYNRGFEFDFYNNVDQYQITNGQYCLLMATHNNDVIFSCMDTNVNVEIGKIYECFFKNGWHIKQIRNDKIQPNFITKTVLPTLKNMNDNIMESILALINNE
jgi:hypothetical protein